ncbi:ABC transporter ATP-binding protein [Reyranella sp. CPCC 100927]|uniref:ABC transporter ATP-binding protein n=1 Tax=Reyranella sp. CPCC 100927 TaxID=2599616 RepID=UPI0011B3A4F7|nr:ABC transporter ATP-binding protein [Reyranella sp. CPCC 100927]TWT15239.1 ABC transporter ATP-binding protein [Reyranella sp. CPCC 100927]
MNGPLLEVHDLVAGYHRDLPIVDGASLSVSASEMVVLLGPNGAGKSTLMKAICGLVLVMGGAIRLDGRDLAGVPTHAAIAAGIGYVPQVQNVFVTLTVEENLRAGGFGTTPQVTRERIAEAYARFPLLAEKRRQLGGALSGGQRQVLAIARALMTQPRLLLLDEPSAGLAPKAAQEVFAAVRGISAGGVGVLMVEQNVKAGLAASDRGIVLVQGRPVLVDKAEALARDPRLTRAFLGERVA